MDIAYIGLGKMGHNMVLRMREKGHRIHAYDPDPVARQRAEDAGIEVYPSLVTLIHRIAGQKTVWLMVPYTVVESILEEIVPLLAKGDTVIEAGNSPFRETMRRADELSHQGIHLLDVGISGGPGGARGGACAMVGGSPSVYEQYEGLFRDITTENGYLYAGKSGAGHFVKMVHNGIEYGMMQAIAEGFDVLRRSEFDIPLTDVARLFNHGSVIESRLIGWLTSGFEAYGEDLAGITGRASASGEGAWTVETAHELRVPIKVIEDAVNARTKSQEKPSFQGQVLSVMRNQFGGHAV